MQGGREKEPEERKMRRGADKTIKGLEFRSESVRI